MSSQHTDSMHDLGTRMCHTRDGLIPYMDDAITRTPEIISPETENGDPFDCYAFACALLDCR